MIDFTPVNLTAGDNRNYPYNLARIVESYKEVYGMHINSSINGTTEIRHPNTILEDAIPCAVIITGPARNGKDTMVNYFEEVFPSLLSISIVDPIYQVCELLLKRDERPEVNNYLNTKDDDWRQFMFEMKESYRKYCNGPIHYVHNKIIRRIIDLAFGKANNPGLICIQSREVHDINTMRMMFTQMGIICVVVYISGQTSENDWKNDSDHNTDRNVADIVIKNENSLFTYESICIDLANMIKNAMSHEDWPKLTILDQIRLFNRLLKL